MILQVSMKAWSPTGDPSTMILLPLSTGIPLSHSTLSQIKVSAVSYYSCHNPPFPKEYPKHSELLEFYQRKAQAAYVSAGRF